MRLEHLWVLIIRTLLSYLREISATWRTLQPPAHFKDWLRQDFMVSIWCPYYMAPGRFARSKETIQTSSISRRDADLTLTDVFTMT